MSQPRPQESLLALVRRTLRMNSDRVIVGQVVTAEVRRGRRERDERGTAAIELVLLAPVLLVVLLFVVGLGRMADARQEIESVASDAARAASLERNTAQSATAARTAAERSLGDAGISCAQLSVNVDVSDYQPGGQVEVSVSCTAQLRDVALSGLPGTKVFTATSIVPIETFRAA